MKIRSPGEVWLADLGMTAKTRPVLIVSRADEDPPRVLYLYVPLTTKYRSSPYEVALSQLPFLPVASYGNVQALGSIGDSRFIRRLGQISEDSLVAVRHALRFALEL